MNTKEIKKTGFIAGGNDKFFKEFSLNNNGQYITPFSRNGKFGFYNETTEEVIVEPLYDAVTPMYGDDKTPSSAMVRKDGNIGFIDINGKIVIPFSEGYKVGYQFINGVAYVSRIPGSIPHIELKAEDYFYK